MADNLGCNFGNQRVGDAEPKDARVECGVLPGDGGGRRRWFLTAHYDFARRDIRLLKRGSE